VSAAVYKGFTEMPSGVTQLSASTFPPGADLAAALAHASRVADLNSGVFAVIAFSLWSGCSGHLKYWLPVYIIYNY
jgi:hypothetical protein